MVFSRLLIKRLDFLKQVKGRKNMLVAAKRDHLESQTNEKEMFLKQLKDLKSTINLFMNWMDERESAYRRAETLLQNELRRKEEMLEARDSTIKELKENLNAKIHDLRNQPSEKEDLLKSRDGQLEQLRSKVNALTRPLTEIESAKERTETLLQDELMRRREMLRVTDAVIKIRELKESLSAKSQNRGGEPSDKGQVDPFEILLTKRR